MSSNKGKPDYDIIVAGAGMVGASAALSFARKGFRVALVEPVPEITKVETTNAIYDLRVSAVSPASQQILSDLGVWSCNR